MALGSSPIATSLRASLRDRKAADDPDTEAVRADLSFTDGKVDGFKFKADLLDVGFLGNPDSDVLTLTARDFTIDTTADQNDPAARVVQFGSVGAQVKIGSLTIGGAARNFGFAPDGSFKPGDPKDANKNFAVELNADSTDGASLGWPSWLPIQINRLGIEFPNFTGRFARLQ